MQLINIYSKFSHLRFHLPLPLMKIGSKKFQKFSEIFCSKSFGKNRKKTPQIKTPPEFWGGGGSDRLGLGWGVYS